MKYLGFCPDYSRWILAVWHGSPFSNISCRKAGAVGTSLSLCSSDFFTPGNLNSPYQSRETRSGISDSEQNDLAVLSGQVSNPKEPASKKENKTPCNSELAHGIGYTGFSSQTPEKRGSRPVYRDREKFCLAHRGHIKLYQPQSTTFQNATTSMVLERHQQHSPGEQVGRHLTVCLALLASSNKK